jgi:hypothetical protein
VTDEQDASNSGCGLLLLAAFYAGLVGLSIVCNDLYRKETILQEKQRMKNTVALSVEDSMHVYLLNPRGDTIKIMYRQADGQYLTQEQILAREEQRHRMHIDSLRSVYK